jgi:carboxymethylenebutenolidase
MKDYMGELEPVTKPVCLLWGDQDNMAPPELLDAYRALVARKKNVELHVFPGVLHGYMMPGNPKAYDAKSRAFSMARALAILQEPRTQPVNA